MDRIAKAQQTELWDKNNVNPTFKKKNFPWVRTRSLLLFSENKFYLSSAEQITWEEKSFLSLFSQKFIFPLKFIFFVGRDSCHSNQSKIEYTQAFKGLSINPEYFSILGKYFSSHPIRTKSFSNFVKFDLKGKLKKKNNWLFSHQTNQSILEFLLSELQMKFFFRK